MTSGGTTYASEAQDFIVIMLNPCVNTLRNWINIPAITLPTQVYKLNSGLKQIAVDSLFSVENALCGSLQVTVDLSSTTSLATYSGGFLEINQSSFGLDGRDTSITITPTLAAYPTYAMYQDTSSRRRQLTTFSISDLPVIMPIRFELCQVTAVTLPTLKEINYALTTEAL